MAYCACQAAGIGLTTRQVFAALWRVFIHILPEQMPQFKEIRLILNSSNHRRLLKQREIRKFIRAEFSVFLLWRFHILPGCARQPRGILTPNDRSAFPSRESDICHFSALPQPHACADAHAREEREVSQQVNEA